MLNIRVLEIGNGIAGAAAAAVLGSLGARVTKLKSTGPGLPPFEPSLPGTEGERVSILTSILDRDKTILETPSNASLPTELLDSDVAICDRVVDDAGFPSDAVDYTSMVERNNRYVWVTLSPFGLSGPYAAYHGCELVSCAAGGLAATVAPKEGGKPSLLPGWQGLLTTGHIAALAALHGLDVSRRRRRPIHVDVSSQEAVAMIGALPECAHAIYKCPGRAGSGRYVAPSGLFPCRDGLVRIVATDNHQWEGMVRAMQEPDWTRGLEQRQARADYASKINHEITLWTQPQSIAECAELLQSHGVPATPVNGPDELLESPQFSARGFIQTVTLNGVETRVPGRPYTWSPTAKSVVSEERADGLCGLRVAEFAHVLAGPIAGALLGAMGARVVRFEDIARLDLYRRTGPFAHGIAGTERGAYFAVANHSKRSLAVDVAASPQAAAELVRQSDVVLENFGSKRMARLQVDAESVLPKNPHLLYVSLSGFGQSGPLAAYRAYANNVHAYGGLTHLTRNEKGELLHVGSVLADPSSSVTAATVIAAWVLGTERQGGVVDLSMAEVVADKLAEFIAEAAAGSTCSMPAGSERFPYAPHGIHPTADGRWLAIAVQSDDEWQSLVEALGRPSSLADSRLSKAAGRWEGRRTIASALDEITSGANADDLFHRLQQAGVRACPVWTGAELLDDLHLAERGFFPRIDHPEPDLTDARLVGLGWRFVGEGTIPLGPPPRLGDYQLEEDAG